MISTNEATLSQWRKDLRKHFDLTLVRSGTEALANLRKKKPDAVVMDHSLEDFMTYAFIDKVRNSPLTRNLPFILISRESSHLFVEQAVRSGVSHYVGVPYEPQMLVEKIHMAVDPKNISKHAEYFRLPEQFETQVISFGRISFIHSEGIHFETHLKLVPDTILSVSSPLSEALKLPALDVKIKNIGTDVYYNYPFAVDAEWADQKGKDLVRAWIQTHRHLNSPKKKKILYVTPDLKTQEEFGRKLDMSRYSLRFNANVEEAIESIPFMRPACVIVHAAHWKTLTPVVSQKFLKALEAQKANWILLSNDKEDVKIAAPFLAPETPEGAVLAVQQVTPPEPVDSERLYFSKTLEDSRVRFHFAGKTLVLGELGARLALQYEALPPCNLQLGLKIFTEQNLRNPFVRIWPPMVKLSGRDSENGKWNYAVESHFLGVNDLQGQAIRQWLRDQELKEKKEALAPKTAEKAPDTAPQAKSPGDVKK